MLIPKAAFILLLLTLAAASPAAAGDSDFAGTRSCAGCHGEQYKSWQGSHHELAMQHANKDSVAGDFNNASITVDGIKTTFFTKDDQFWINTEAANGQLQDFLVSYTFGVTPLQQYLIEFPDGRIQALGIAWDTRPQSAGGQRWFNLFPDEIIAAGDELHWTGRQQNWNYMCADCHSTDLKKGYNASTDTFKTTWSDINVGCESCHGPGKKHIAWAMQSDADRAEEPAAGLPYLLNDLDGTSWVMDPQTGTAKRSPAATANTEIGVCAACHSRRGEIKEGIEADGSFLDHYRPALLSADLYHADGQILDEVYVWGSFEQSKMRAAGVTCSNCHEPHSLQLRAPQQQVCSQCHLPARYVTTEHHQHQQGSEGANCLNCHMPAKTYMVIDPRRDHSMRIPRPDLSLKFDTPDACSQCHTDKSTDWAAAQFNRLWPQAKMPFQSWTTSLSQARAGLPQAEISLIRIIRDQTLPGLARATALSELGPYLSPLSGSVLQNVLSDSDPLVRFAALGVLDSIAPENRYQLAQPLLQDPIRLVRTEAARVSAAALRTSLPPNDLQILRAAFNEYVDTQLHNADRPEAYLNLGIVYSQAGEAVAAEKAYRQAIKLEPHFGPAYNNLADLYRQQGLDKNAGKVLAEGIAQQPEDAALHHAFGLLQARNSQLDAAIVSLEKAAVLAPDVARYTYVYGVALNSAGRPAAAINELKKGHQQHPGNREIIFMIASIYRDQGNKTEALEWARKLLALNPADQQAERFIQQLNSTG